VGVIDLGRAVILSRFNIKGFILSVLPLLSQEPKESIVVFRLLNEVSGVRCAGRRCGSINLGEKNGLAIPFLYCPNLAVLFGWVPCPPLAFRRGVAVGFFRSNNGTRR
jgi:hypothetical protein